MKKSLNLSLKHLWALWKDPVLYCLKIERFSESCIIVRVFFFSNLRRKYWWYFLCKCSDFWKQFWQLISIKRDSWYIWIIKWTEKRYVFQKIVQ